MRGHWALGNQADRHSGGQVFGWSGIPVGRKCSGGQDVVGKFDRGQCNPYGRMRCSRSWRIHQRHRAGIRAIRLSGNETGSHGEERCICSNSSVPMRLLSKLTALEPAPNSDVASPLVREVVITRVLGFIFLILVLIHSVSWVRSSACSGLHPTRSNVRSIHIGSVLIAHRGSPLEMRTQLAGTG